MATAPTVSSSTSPASGLRSGIGRVLVFAFLGTLFDGAELNLVGYPQSFVADTLHVQIANIVEVTTLQGFASIVGGILCGWLGDMIGRRWTYTGSVLVFGLAALLGGLAPTYGIYLLTRLLAGIGMGGLFGLSYSMFAEAWKTTRRGVMGSAIQAMYYLGQILTEGVIYFCIVQFGTSQGWRTGYILIGAGTLVIGLLAGIVLPESEAWKTYRRELKAGRVPPEMRQTKVPLVDLFRRGMASGTILFVVLSTAMFVTSNSLIAYLSTFLIKVEKVPLGTASLIVLLGLIVTPIVYLIAGLLSDRFGRKWAFFFSSLFGIIGFAWFLILVLTHSAHIGANFWASQVFWAIMLCAAATGGFAIIGVWMSEFFPTRIRASGSNLSYYAGRGFGAGLFPLIALTIAGSVPLALAFGIVGPIAGVVFGLLPKDRAGREIKAVE